jgi:hypothetical protein
MVFFVMPNFLYGGNLILHGGFLIFYGNVFYRRNLFLFLKGCENVKLRFICLLVCLIYLFI